MQIDPCVNNTVFPTSGIRYSVTYSECTVSTVKNDNTGAHIHNCYEMYLKLDGNVSFLVNDHIFPIDTDCIIFTRPNDVHYCIYNSECRHEHFCLWIDLPSNCSPFGFTNSDDFNGYIKLDFTSKERMVTLLNLLHEGSNSELERTATLFELMSLIEKNALRRSDDPNSARIPKEMQKILDYINSNFTEIKYVKDIYDVFFISPATLSRWFEKYIGTSPHEFLESKKLALAKKLLNGGRSVTDSSTLSGFADNSYFTYVFKKKFGITPTEYRRNLTE